ncbi:MAG: hypothetical protein ACR2OU_05215, partial [Thermomicrobiales bacterium]
MDLTDKNSDAASDVGNTVDKLRDQVLGAPGNLRNAFSETDQNTEIASNTDDTVRLDDLTPSPFASDAVDIGNATQNPATPSGSEGMRSLYHGTASASGAPESPASGSGSGSGSAAASSEGADLNLGTSAGAQSGLDHGVSPFTSHAGDTGTREDDEPVALTGTTPGDQQPDLSGTAYDRADAESTFRDLSAADSLASGSYADEELLDTPDSDLQGFSDLRAEDLGALEDIESGISAADGGDDFEARSSVESDTNTQLDQSQLSGTLGDEGDALDDTADGTVLLDDMLVVEDDVFIQSWDVVTGSTLDSTAIANTAFLSDSTETDIPEEDQTVGIAGMPGTSEASGMSDAAETILASDGEPGSEAAFESGDHGSLTSSQGGESRSANLPATSDSETEPPAGSSSTAGADTAARIDSTTAERPTQESEHFGFLGYDNTETTDLSYLNQANSRRFEFSTAVQTSTSSADSQAPSQDAKQDGESDRSDSKSGQLADSEANWGATGKAKSTAVSVNPSDSTPGNSSAADTEAKPQPADSSTASAEETSDSSPAYVHGIARKNAANTDSALHTTTQNGATSAQATTGASSQSTAEQTGPGGSIKGDKSGSCPANYPIKGNGSSKIYHMPGIPSYLGTKAELCFATEADAIAAGFRAPGKRNHSAGTAAQVSSSEASSAPGSAPGTSDEETSTSHQQTPVTTNAEPAGTTAPASTSDLSDAGNGADRSSGAIAGNTPASGNTEHQVGS